MSLGNAIGSMLLGQVGNIISKASAVSPGPGGTIGRTSQNKTTIIAASSPRPTSELRNLQPGPAQGGNGYTVLRYPQELQGNSLENPPHAVMFYINVPKTSGYQTGNKEDTVIASSFDQTQSSNKMSASDIANSQISNAQLNRAIGTSLSGTTTLNSLLEPSLKRITQAVALYMPDTIASRYTHDWRPVSLTEQLGQLGNIAVTAAGAADLIKQGLSATQSLSGANVKQAPLTPAGIELAGIIGKAVGTGSETESILLNSLGTAINPQVEMLYKGTPNRQFIFEFKFQPRNSAEALEISKIITTFKMYAAPELITSQTNSSFFGRYFIPPAQFDIEFMFSNQPNTYLPKLSTCVLENINVNYSQAGQFATFEDGMPVEIGLELRFIEVDIMYRQLIQLRGY